MAITAANTQIMAIRSSTQKKKALAITSAKSQHEILKTPMW